MTTDELMAEVERLRGVLARIEALVWYEPEDEDDLVEAVRVMACERNEAIKQSRHALRERDAAHAEAERLRRDLARCREAQRATAEGWRHEVAEIAAIVGAPAHTAELAAYVRAEVERLRGERDEAMADFANACDVGRRQEARAEKAERERDEARKEAERTQRLLDHATQSNPGTSTLVMLMNEAREARAEASALRAHFDAAAPEHNLPALLDLYDNRRAAAESERDQAWAEVERLRVALSQAQRADE